jgi:hypothetical protein
MTNIKCKYFRAKNGVDMPEITDQELELLNKYKELGNANDIERVFQEYAIVKRQLMLDQVSEVSGLNKIVLDDLVRDETFEIKQEDDQEIVYVLVDAQEAIPLEEYVETKWKHFLPSLLQDQQHKKEGKKVIGSQPSGKIDDRPSATKKIARDFIKNKYTQTK